MASSRAWFVLAVAGVLGLIYVGHGLHRGDDAVWQLPMGNVAMAQEAGNDGGLTFRPIPDNNGDIQINIAKVPGGWLVDAFDTRVGRGDGSGVGLTFLPDPQHKWDGKSVK